MLSKELLQAEQIVIDINNKNKKNTTEVTTAIKAGPIATEIIFETIDEEQIVYIMYHEVRR